MMPKRALIVMLGLLSCQLIPRDSVAATGVESPILVQKSQSEIELDLGMMVRDLLPPLLETMKLEDEAKAAKAQSLIDLIGLGALDRLRMVSTADERGSHTTVTVSVDPTVHGGLLSALLSLPPGEFRFARYVRPEDALLVASFESFAQGAGWALEELTELEADGPFRIAPPGADSSFARIAADLQRDVMPLLSGEMDILLFPADPEKASKIPPMALVFGSTDGARLLDRVFGLMAPKLGEEQIAALKSMPAETVGEFAFHSLPVGWSYAVSPEFLIVTSDTARLRRMLTEPAGTLVVPPGRHYLRVDGRFFVDMLTAKTTAGKPSSPDAQLKAEVLQTIGKASAGAIEIFTTSEPSRWMIEMRQQGSMMDLQYAALREFLQVAPRMKALELREKRYREAVALLDKAMTRYGEEHEGVFPKKLESLVKEGYLDALPDFKPTPLGKYVEGSYTYVPLRDEDGVIAGYFYFVYGVDPNGGFDILTEGSVSDPGNFVAARDGKPDGIVSFCYDGIAIRQMEARGGE
jgi:hypothetical protein